MTTIFKHGRDKVAVLPGKVTAEAKVPNQVIRREATDTRPLGHGWHGDVEEKKRILMLLPPGNFPEVPWDLASSIIESSFGGSLIEVSRRAKSGRVTIKVGAKDTLFSLFINASVEATQLSIRPNEPGSIARSFVRGILCNV